MKVDFDVLLPFTSFCAEGITTREVKEHRFFDIFGNNQSNGNVSSNLSVAISTGNDNGTITTDQRRLIQKFHDLYLGNRFLLISLLPMLISALTNTKMNH